MEKEIKCCFCGAKIPGYGNNPYPVNKDSNARCCTQCNMSIVVPSRISDMFTHGKK